VVALHCHLGESLLRSTTHTSPAVKNVQELITRGNPWFCFSRTHRSPWSIIARAKPLLIMSCAKMDRGRPEDLLAWRSRISKADFRLLKMIVCLPATSRYITSPYFHDFVSILRTNVQHSLKRFLQSREDNHLLSANWYKFPMIGRRRGWGGSFFRELLA